MAKKASTRKKKLATSRVQPSNLAKNDALAGFIDKLVQTKLKSHKG